ncbi:MAG: hypothetical protein EXR69_16190 [Myxococcales bacterium]|nr:hypothetical protein [Myxococcales bacterium]
MLALLVALAFPAEPEAPLPASVANTTAAQVTPAGHRVDAAVSLYLAGETSQARRVLLAVLVDRDTLSPEDRQDALAWLGDIQFAEQGITAAQSVMATLLAENPEYAVDPMQHPPEFCDAFERLRADLRTTAPTLATKHPYPWELGLPFGIGYFIDSKPLSGVVLGTLQAGGLVASLATRARMRTLQTSGDPPGIDELDEEATKEFLTARSVNLASVCIGWGAWGIPFIVETARWSGSRGPRVTQIELRGNGLELGGTF